MCVILGVFGRAKYVTVAALEVDKLPSVGSSLTLRRRQIVKVYSGEASTVVVGVHTVVEVEDNAGFIMVRFGVGTGA